MIRRKPCLSIIFLLQPSAGFLLARQRQLPLPTNTATNRHDRNASTRHYSKVENEATEASQHSFRLPIFPLRKTVRLPTEKLTLNLYEDRYLAMAEDILSSENTISFFGAMYSSNKAQIVKDGEGPIVPLLQIGDVGVIFVVTHSQEDMIPTVGGQGRRRIRLEAIGTARFQIQEILCNGYQRGLDENLPYIVVHAQLYTETIQEGGNTVSRLIPPDMEICFDNLTQRVKMALGSHVSVYSLNAELASFVLASARQADAEIEGRLKVLRLQSIMERITSFLSK
jgi:Lon protease-like protein